MSNETPRLLSKIFVQGEIICKTGLHIGGSNTQFEIGNVNLVIRDPVSGEPYIPGSSLKGKMRSLTELYFGAFSESKGNQGMSWGPYAGDPEYLERLYSGGEPDASRKDYPHIRQLYGFAVLNNKNLKRPGRLLVRDAMLTSDSREELERSSYTERPYTTVKTEVALDRITAESNPRNNERVPAGARFKMQFVVNEIQGDKPVTELLDHLFLGLYLLQDDALGGSGSRGYGQVQFKILREDVQRMSAKAYKTGGARELYSHPNLDAFLKRFEPESA